MTKMKTMQELDSWRHTGTNSKQKEKYNLKSFYPALKSRRKKQQDKKITALWRSYLDQHGTKRSQGEKKEEEEEEEEGGGALKKKGKKKG